MVKPTSSTQPSSSDKKGGLTFPCEFVVKVFGMASDEFKTHILSLLRKNLPNLSQDAIQQRPSKDGKYVALSITVHVECQAQLDEIYYTLTKDPSVLMAL